MSEVDDIPGFLQGRLEFTLNKEKDIHVPSLTGWKFQDSLPEVKDGFDDSRWVTADHTATNITQKPLFGDGRVLYGVYSTLYEWLSTNVVMYDRMRLRVVSIGAASSFDLYSHSHCDPAAKILYSGVVTSRDRLRLQPSISLSTVAVVRHLALDPINVFVLISP